MGIDFGKIVNKLQTALWWFLSFALKTLPKVANALESLGLHSWHQALDAAADKGGVWLDDLIEQNVPTLDKIDEACDKDIAWLTSMKALARDINFEGTKERAPGELDAVVPALWAEWMGRIAGLEGEVGAFTGAVSEVHPLLLSAVQTPMVADRDPTRSPALGG